MGAIYLEHISMQGLFGYRNVAWHVNQDVNILGGDNGSGKSSVFHICSELLGRGYLEDERYIHIVDSVTLSFTNGYKLVWDKQKVNSSFRQMKGYTYHSVNVNRVSKDGLFVMQRTQVTDEKGRVVDLRTIIDSVPTLFLSSFDQYIREARKVTDDTDGGDKTYLDLLLASSIAYRNSKVSQILINSITQNVNSREASGEHQFSISKKDSNYISLFNQALLDFFGENYSIKAGMESQISLTSKNTGEVINYQSLSLGEKEMLLLILTVSNTYDAPVLIWLDEPDLGLHVDWQVKLVRCLRKLNPNIQLFVSTHAPSVVEGNQEKVSEMSEISTLSR